MGAEDGTVDRRELLSGVEETNCWYADWSINPGMAWPTGKKEKGLARVSGSHAPRPGGGAIAA